MQDDFKSKLLDSFQASFIQLLGFEIFDPQMFGSRAKKETKTLILKDLNEGSDFDFSDFELLESLEIQA